MWPSHIAKPLKRAPIKRSAEDGEDFTRRSGMDDIRGRHPMFRMPAWMSEDDDMSDLAARMSHTPHFATMGRRSGPWRERRSSGGSAMSATSDDSCDAPTTDKSSQCSGGSSEAPSHEIPIRLEAPCPPSMVQQPQQQQQPQTEVENEPISPLTSAFNQARKGTQYPVRTTSAVDATQPFENVQRNTRCSSAPPEMADQALPQEAPKPAQQQRFVSKINITPQSPLSPACSKSTAIPFSPLPAKFNTVPKPFVPVNKQSEPQAAPYTFEAPHVPEPQQQQDNQQYQAQQPHQPQQQQQYQQPQQQQYQPQQQQQQYPPQQQFHPQQQQFQPQQQYQPQQHQQQQQQQQQQPQQPQQPQQQQSPRQGGQRPSIVRNIPIFVEGRDGPVTNEESNTPPKSTPQWGQPRQQQQQQYQQQPPMPQQQPMPQQHQQHTPQKTQFRQHTQQPQPQAQTQPIPTPIPAPPPPQQQQPEAQAKPQPAKDPRLTQIEIVRASVEEYKAKVDVFPGGSKKGREFLYLDEMLTRALLQLDNVDPEGREDVRQARRAVIKSINAAISLLESKGSDPKKEKTPENAVVSMETENQEQSAGTKDSQEVSDKTSDSKEPAVTLSGNNTDNNAEVPKEENMETGESQNPTSASTEKEAAVTTST